MTKRRLYRVLLVTALSLTGFSPASSRIWKPSPDKLAANYAMIQDLRGGGEIVFIEWLAPSIVAPGVSGAKQFAATLQKYVVILVAHGRIDKTTGSTSFDEITTLEAKDETGKALTVVARSDLPPVINGVLSGLESIFRQAFGAFGKGTKMFVFDAGSVNSCKKGGMSVPFANETYTWETPFPGC